MTDHPSNGSGRRQGSFGTLAIILGFLSFAAVVGHFFTGPLDPPPPIEVSIADKAVAIRDATVAALRGEAYRGEVGSQPRRLDDYLTYAFMTLALIAILMAVIGLIRRESLRLNVAGAALGVLAIAFQITLTLFLALLFVLLLAAVLDQLDFGF